MILDFQQGIVSYPSTANVQQFLVPGSMANYVSLSAVDGRTDVAFAYGSDNYLFSETTNVVNAWGPLPTNTSSWLYWDLDTQTAARTFGFTLIQPLVAAVAPTAQEDQHWFDQSSKLMKVYTSGQWRTVIRVFAARFQNGFFYPLGSGFPLAPYAGTQAGLTVAGTTVGRILADDVGRPVRKGSGQFFTTESHFFINGSPVNVLRLESNVITGTAQQAISKYQVVKFSQFNEIIPASYNDQETTAVAMLLEDLVANQAGSLCVQGYVTNPLWNWATVGAPLWLHGSLSGELTDVDPHLSDPVTYPVGHPPIARVFARTSVFFDQGLGGKGDKGDTSVVSPPHATTSTSGVAKLSVAAVDPNIPIVVGTNDPRLTPYTHPASHPASMITATPVGALTGATVQDDLALIDATFINKHGDQMLGTLLLAADPTQNMEAATKQYVDAHIAAPVADLPWTKSFDGNTISVAVGDTTYLPLEFDVGHLPTTVGTFSTDVSTPTHKPYFVAADTCLALFTVRFVINPSVPAGTYMDVIMCMSGGVTELGVPTFNPQTTTAFVMEHMHVTSPPVSLSGGYTWFPVAVTFTQPVTSGQCYFFTVTNASSSTFTVDHAEVTVARIGPTNAF